MPPRIPGKQAGRGPWPPAWRGQRGAALLRGGRYSWHRIALRWRSLLRGSLSAGGRRRALEQSGVFYGDF